MKNYIETTDFQYGPESIISLFDGIEENMQRNHQNDMINMFLGVSLASFKVMAFGYFLDHLNWSIIL
jgi:hypothetical protein